MVHGSVLTRKALRNYGRLYSRASIPKNHDATKYRDWVHLNKPSSDSNDIVSVMSYNILCRHYVWQPVFGYLKQEYLNWSSYRFPLINKIILQLECDIMCFQEMEYLVYDSFWSRDFPTSKYHSFYVKKPKPIYWGDMPDEFMDGVAIFVNSERFDVLDHLHINFGEYIRQHLSRFDITDHTFERVIPRNTVALVVKLYDKLSRRVVYVTNTHLYWSPEFNDVKIIQTKILLNILQEFIDPKDTKDPCIIMCGDYNSSPTSKVFQLLDSGLINTADCKEFSVYKYGKKLNSEIIHDGIIRNPFRLSCAYETLLHSLGTDKKLQFTSFTKSLEDVVDHIWYTGSHFKITKLLGKVSHTYYSQEDVLGFPDRNFPSDHIPLVTELSYI